MSRASQILHQLSDAQRKCTNIELTILLSEDIARICKNQDLRLTKAEIIPDMNQLVKQRTQNLCSVPLYDENCSSCRRNYCKQLCHNRVPLYRFVNNLHHVP